MIVAIIFAVLTFLVFLYFELKRQFLVAFFFKTLASFSFILILVSTLIYGNWVNSNWLGYMSTEHVGLAYLFLLGLICGFAGDLILALRPFFDKEKHTQIIFAGTIAFAIGHVFYLFGLLKLMDFSWWAIVFSVIATSLIFIIGIFVMKLNFKKLLIPSIIYSSLLFLMVGMTIFGFNDFDRQPFAIVIMVSAILFGLSDIVLSQIYFGDKETNLLKAINLSLYYLAQIGIASSILFFI